MRGEREPRLKNWYILTWPGGGTIGARVVDEKRIGELERLIRDTITAGLPDTRVFTTEGELFGGIGGSARSVGIHLQSENTAALYQVAISGRALLEKVFPGATVLSFPNPEDADLELHAIPDDRRIAELGWDRATVGTIVRTVGEGAWLGEYFDGKSRLPIILRSNEGVTPEELADAPLVTPTGLTVRLGDLVQLSTVLGPPGIRRLNHRRTVTLTVDPPASLSLEKVLHSIDTQVLPALRAQLPPDGSLRLAGSADNLSQTLSTMSRVFAMALIVLLLLMTVLFRSLRDSLIVLLTVPLALVGGVVGLRLLDLIKFQALDLLSMIGFVMMIGVIINHAILLVAAVRSVEARGWQSGSGHSRRAAAAPARDPREHADRGAGRVADGRQSGSRQRHLPRARGRQYRWRRDQPGLQPGADPLAHAAAAAARQARPGSHRRPRCRSHERPPAPRRTCPAAHRPGRVTRRRRPERPQRPSRRPPSASSWKSPP